MHSFYALLGTGWEKGEIKNPNNLLSRLLGDSSPWDAMVLLVSSGVGL